MQSLRLFLARVWRPLPILVVLLALPAVSSPAWSVPAPAAPAEQDRMTGHDRVSAVEERRLQHLFWAYNAIWLLLGSYLVSLGVRLRTVNRELARLEERLLQADRGPSNGP